MASTGESVGEWLSAPKAARRIGKSEDFIRRLVRDGKVTVRQIEGHRWEIDRGDLDRLMAESIRPAKRGPLMAQPGA